MAEAQQQYSSTYSYGGAQQGYNPYDAYNYQGGGQSYEWSGGADAQAQQQEQQQGQQQGQQGGYQGHEGQWANGQHQQWNGHQGQWNQNQQWGGQWGQQQQQWGGQNQQWQQHGYQQQQYPQQQQQQQQQQQENKPLPAAAQDQGPPVPDPSGVGVWEPVKDTNSGKVYWVNHALQKTAWEPPKTSGGQSQSQQSAQQQSQQQAQTQPHQAQAQQHAHGQQQNQAHQHQNAWNQHNQYNSWGQHQGNQQHQQHQQHQHHQGYYQNQHQQQNDHHQPQQYQQQHQQQQHQQYQQNQGQSAAQGKNAFAWTAKPKPPPPKGPNTFQWSDGRDHQPGSSYDKDYPPLGSPKPQPPQPHPNPAVAAAAAAAAAAVKAKMLAQAEQKEEAKPQGNAMGGGQWPPALQKFVERAFKECTNDYERECMQRTLKQIIENASNHNRLWVTNWDIQPLPRVANSAGSSKSPKNKYEERELKTRKSKKRHLAAVSDGETAAEREARDKRHKRFMDMERGFVPSGPSVSAGGDADDIKFISSSAILGTCMTMEKMYIRLQSMPDPSTVRPERVLVKWADSLKRQYYNDQADWEWISDQYKAIRQDLFIQHIRNENAVRIYEMNARLALLEDDYGEFHKIESYLADLQMDTGIVENRTEFLAYRMFYWEMNGTTVEIIKMLRNFTPEQKADPCVKHAIKACEAYELSDYHTFFFLYDRTPNMGRTLLKNIRDRIRSRALRVILKSYKPSVPVAFLRTSLGFKPTQADKMEDSEQAKEKDDDDDDDDEAWDLFTSDIHMETVEGDSTLVDVKATLEALAQAERE